MEEAAETLVRLRDARKIYLRSIKNSERDILEMIENFSIDDENSTIKLTSAKVSLQDRINKVKQQDEEILKVLKTEDMENKILKCPAVIENFEKQLKFNGQRYVTKLPFVKDPYTLPDNYLIAKSRLETNFKRLQTDPKLLQSYDDVIKEYLSYGIVEKVTASNTNYVHYLPHRTVVRDERETTKLRVIFDASAKYKGFPSLNELLDPGPCLLPHLFDTLIRFRLGKIALISDIKQAFLQIQINTEHRDFLRFLWYDDIRTDFPTSVLRFTRLVFGLTSSPFILNATIKFHLSQYLGEEKFKWVIEKFLQDL